MAPFIGTRHTHGGFCPGDFIGVGTPCLLSEAQSTHTGGFSEVLIHLARNQYRPGLPPQKQLEKDGWYFRKARGSELNAFRFITSLGSCFPLNQTLTEQPAQNSVFGAFAGSCTFKV